MENGKWEMGNREWKLGNGKREGSPVISRSHLKIEIFTEIP